MPRMTSLTLILFIDFIYNLAFAFWLNSNMQDNIKFVGHISIWFGVYIIRIDSVSLAHAVPNYHVLLFGNWYQNNADM